MRARDDLIAGFGAEVELVKSSGGVFEVSAGERLLFSKKSLGRFPESGELEKLIRDGRASAEARV